MNKTNYWRTIKITSKKINEKRIWRKVKDLKIEVSEIRLSNSYDLK